MKLVVPGNAAVDTSSDRRETLVRQLDAELRPVLRQTDFDDFDLEAALQTVYLLAEAVDNLKASINQSSVGTNPTHADRPARPADRRNR